MHQGGGNVLPASLDAVNRHTGAMPARSPRPAARNLTGVYVGAAMGDEHGGLTSPKIPPLSGRGRGRPSYRVRTPTEKNRYKKVEQLRVREPSQGFSGRTLKRIVPMSTATELAGSGASEAHHKHPFLHDNTTNQTIWDLTKKTTRSFTAANNSGFTHLEYLEASGAGTPAGTPAAASVGSPRLRTQQSMVEYCNKIFRGDIDALLNNGSRNKKRTRQAYPNYTGFAVKEVLPVSEADMDESSRSYRNPHTAEIIATFPVCQDSRPRTVIGGQYYPNNSPHPDTIAATAVVPSGNTPPTTPQPQHKQPQHKQMSSPAPPPPSRPQTSRKGSDHSVEIPLPPPTQDVTHVTTHQSHLHSDQHSTDKPQHCTDLVGQEGKHPEEQAGTSSKQAAVQSVESKKVVDQSEDSKEVVDQSEERKQEVDQSEDRKEVVDQSDESKEVIEQSKECKEAVDQSEDTKEVVDLAEERKEVVDQSEEHKEVVDQSEESKEAVDQSESIIQSVDQSASHSIDKDPEAEEMTGLVAGESGGVRIALEDESGESCPVDIDEADEEEAATLAAMDTENIDTGRQQKQDDEDCVLKRKVSITARVLKSRNSEQELASLQQAADSRKQELADLLNEHAQIVHTVEAMQDGGSSKENSTPSSPH